MVDEELDYKNIWNLKDVDNILKLEVGKDKTIEDFIKETSEGRALIPDDGNVGIICLAELNEALETENYDKIGFKDRNGVTLDDSINLMGIQKLADKEKQTKKQKSYEEEM